MTPKLSISNISSLPRRHPLLDSVTEASACSPVVEAWKTAATSFVTAMCICMYISIYIYIVYVTYKYVKYVIYIYVIYVIYSIYVC